MSADLYINATGMVTAVGLDALSSCAAMRGRLDGFAETRFVGAGSDWLIGAAVPLPRNWIGPKRLAHLAVASIVEVLRQHPMAEHDLEIILCLSEPERKGRPVQHPASFANLVREIGELPPKTVVSVVEHGRPSGFAALERARRSLTSGQIKHVLIVGVDSYLTGQSVAHYLGVDRLLTPENADGFIPGEAAATILVSADIDGPLALTGLGLAREEAFIYNELDEGGLHKPLRGDGMTSAYKAALDQAGTTMAGIEYRIGDLIGEKYFFKQSALAALRLERGRSEFQDFWSPGENVGNVGAAVVPLMMGMALIATEKNYDMGSPVLIEASGDDGACGAAVLRARLS